MDTIDKTTDEQAIVELKGLIERTLASARVPRETRSRLSATLEVAMRENLSLVRRYVRTLAYDGRAAEMMEMYSQGHTLDEIGACFDLTRERVRQILTSTFGDYRSAVPQELIHERSLRRLAKRTAEWDEKYGPEVTRLFSEGKSDSAIAEVLGVARTRVTDYRSRKGLRHTRSQDWSDDDLLNALRIAEKESGEGLTIARYNAWREKAGPGSYPSYLTMLIRFESFEDACKEAKVNYIGRSNSERRSDYISPEMAREHLAAFLDWAVANNRRPTSGSFVEYRKVVPETPSMAVMSRRLGGFRAALDALIASRSQ